MHENAENRVGKRGRRLAVGVFALTLPLAALAQFSIPAPPPPTPSESAAPDPHGLETPRGCYFGFLQAVERGNFQTAAALKLVAFVLVLIFALAAFGVNLTATLAGVEIGGLVLAFAAQKSLESMFGGIAVPSDRALRVGDMCKIGGQQGEVEDITLWATRLRTQERTVVSIPNGVVMGAQIENLSRRDRYWFHPIVGLVYETTAEQMRQVLSGVRALLAADARVDQANPRAHLLRLGASSLDIETSAYVRSVTQHDFLAAQEELLLRILRIVEEAGTALAFPAQPVSLAGGQTTGPDEGKRA